MNSQEFLNHLSGYWETINWAAVWEEKAQTNHQCRHNIDFTSVWSSREKAQEYQQMVKAQEARYQPIRSCIPLGPGKRILDIGAGPGTLSLPLAASGSQVTVVEPARGMVEVMMETAEQEGVLGITILEHSWEDVPMESLGRYDVIISCFSMIFQDIKKAIEKMLAVSDGCIILVWYSGITPWERMVTELWPKVFEKNYAPGPKSDLLYLVLAQMGVSPEVNSYAIPYYERYESVDEAVSDIVERMGPVPDDKKGVIEEYVRSVGILRDDGFWYDDTVTITVFRWDTGE